MKTKELPESLAGRYQVRRALGIGSYGSVLLAHDRELGREVALKLLDLTEGQSRQRFEDEARLTASLQHPGIVSLYDHGVTPEGVSFIVYEFIEGENLLEHVARVGAPSQEELRRWGSQVAEALAACHEVGVLHRDVKPPNVLLREGEAVLCDFGLAHSGREDRSVRTRTGMLVGSPFYLAPEVWQGKKPGPASDQWSWAIGLVRLALEPEDEDEVNPANALAGCLRVGVADEETWKVLDPLGGIGRILRKALEPDPADRYRNMREFAAALTGKLPATPGGVTLEAKRVSSASASQIGPTAARPFPPLAVAGLAALLLVGFLWLRPGGAAVNGPTEPPTAGPPPENRDLTRAKERVDEAARAVLREHGPWSPRPRWSIGDFRTWLSHVEPTLPVLADQQFEILFDEFLHALQIWVRELRRLGRPLSGEEELELGEHLSFAGHVLLDHRVADYASAVARTVLLSPNFAHYVQRASRFSPEQIAQARKLADSLRAWDDPSPLVGLRFASFISSIHEDRSTAGDLRRLLEPWPQGPDAAQGRMIRIDAVLMGLEQILYQQHMPCALRRELMQTARSRFDAERPPRPARERVDFLASWSRGQVTYLAACAGKTSAEDFEELDTATMELLATPSAHPRLIDLARLMRDNLEDRIALYGEKHPELERRFERLETAASEDG